MSELLSEEEFDRCIDWLRSSGEDVSADALQAERAARKAAESRLAEVEKERDRMAKALLSIAEGNLGDNPWQADYGSIRALARAALSKEKAT